jgi:integrase/recombinase XerD
MAISKVSVYTRTTDANGKRRYEQADHRTLYPDGTIFCLRYEVDGKRKWETLTGEMITYKYALCRAKLRESDLLMGAINVAKHAPVVPVPAQPAKPTRLTVDEAMERYLRNASTKSPRTFHGYTYTLTQFRQSCQKQFLDEINKQDLYDFVTYLRVQGLGDRTIHNRVEEVVGLLRHYDIMNVTIKVKYTEKKISAYTREELRSLFAVCDAEDRLVFEFFLGSGCRESEVSHACWEDVNFEAKTYTVREHLELGFRPKDREEREVPLPDALVAALQQRRPVYPNAKLIFPNKQGRPEGHFLRRLQIIVKNTGLAGKWELHKFRKTFATMHHEQAGISARTLQKWLGHSSLETTLAYLEAADVRSERTRQQVNSSFAVLQVEPAAATVQ